MEGHSVKPDYFFLDPELVMSSPIKLKASAGFDAISQAIESMISTKSTHQSLEFAKISLNLSSKNFIKFLEKKIIKIIQDQCVSRRHYSEKQSHLKNNCTTRYFLSFTSTSV